MRTPPTFVIYRVATATITLLALLAFGIGLGGLGPLDGLNTLTNHAVDWFQANTRVILR